MAERNEMRSLSRALSVIQVLTRSAHPLSLSEVAERSALTPSTAKRILLTLEAFAMVRQHHRRYAIGEMAAPMAQSYLDNDPVRRAATPELERLARSTGLTASLYVRHGSERILVARVEGEHGLPYRLQLGKLMPLTRGAGKILLAAEDDAGVEAVLDDARAIGYEPESTTADEIRERLADAREQGFSLSEGERVAGTITIAVSLPEPASEEGRPLYALSVAGPQREVSRERIVGLVPSLQNLAHALSVVLAH